MWSKGNKRKARGGEGIALGVALGVALGAAMNNVGAGLAIGLALGVAWDAAQRRKRSKSDQTDQDESGGEPPG